MTFIDTYTRKLAGAFIARSKVLLAIAGILLLSRTHCLRSDRKMMMAAVEAVMTLTPLVVLLPGHMGEVSLALTYGEEN